MAMQGDMPMTGSFTLYDGINKCLVEDSRLVKGASVTIASLEDINEIPSYARQKGQLIYVESEDKTYQFVGGISNENLQELQTGAGDIIDGGFFDESVPEPEPVINLASYNPITWAEWELDSGVEGNSAGLEFTASGSAIGANLPMTLTPGINYGILYEVVSSTISGYFGVSNNSAFASANLPKVSGANKAVLTAKSTITDELLRIYIGSENVEGQIIIKNIRVFELLEGSDIANDFDSLSASALDSKYPFEEVEETIVNELAYNPVTWEEWILDEGVSGDETGLEFTAPGGTAIGATLLTSVKESANYGLLYEVVSGTGENLGVSSTGAFAVSGKILSSSIGLRKDSLPTNATIVDNQFRIFLGSSNSAGTKLKVKDLRLFELPEGSEIANDFATLSASALDEKYPFGGGV